MAKRPKISKEEEVIQLLRTGVIVQLALAGVSQKAIRNIVGGDIYKVAGIVKHIKLKDNTKE